VERRLLGWIEAQADGLVLRQAQDRN